MITGWYGTETAGDKAILGALFSYLRRYAPQCVRITLCTLNRRVCEQTLFELGEQDVRLVPLAEAARARLIAQCDAVIVGGGPLFPIPPLLHIQEQFEEAARQGRARVLFGCGVGPLSGHGYIQALVRIAKLATAGFYRDEESRKAAIRFGGNTELGVGFDPSLAYLRNWVAGLDIAAPATTERRLAVLMRANTTEYVHGAKPDELDAANRNVADRVACALRAVAEQGGLEARLLPMHCLHVGGDDRLFNRWIESAGLERCVGHTTRGYLPLHDLLAEIQASTLTLPMRYHGHLFSLALGKPFVSVDYSGRSGKVRHFIERLAWEDFSVRWADFRAEDLATRITQALEQTSELGPRLQRAGDEFSTTLQQAYTALAAV